MHRRIGIVALALFSLIFGNIPAAAAPALRIPGLPPEVAFGQATAPQVGELTNRRTKDSKTSRNANGTYTTTVFGGPVHYRDRAGKWQDIRSNLVPTTQSGYAWRNEANLFGLLFKKDLAKDFMRVDTAGKSFAFSLNNAADKAAVASGTHVTYKDALPGASLRYDLTNGGAKETLILSGPSSPSHFQFTLTPPAKTTLSVRRERSGSWSFLMPGHHGPVFSLDPAVAMDSTGNVQAVSDDGKIASLTVSKNAGGFLIDVSLDPAWLHDSSRRFPVELDPTITIQPDSQDDYFHGNVSTDVGQLGSGTALHIGDSASHYDWGAVQYDLSAIPPGASITTATAGLYYNSYLSTSPSSFGSTHVIEAHRMTNPWSSATQTQGLAFDPTALSTLTMTVDNNARWMSWDVTAAAKTWYAGTQPNYGVIFKHQTETLNSGGPAPVSHNYTADTTLLPKLDVTYNTDGVTLNQPTTLHSNGAELSWSQYTGSLSGAAFQRYEVHRSATKNFAPSAATLLTTINDVSQTAFRDTTAAPNGTFYYEVVANSSGSNQVQVALPADGQAVKNMQPGTGQSQDTYITYWNNATGCNNFGANTDMSVGTDTNSISRGLFSYQLSDIPTGSTISNATLSLYHYNSVPNAQTLHAYAVTHAWNEGTGVSNPSSCTGNGATWYEANGGVNWTNQGGDFSATAGGAVTTVAGEGAKWHNFDITAMAQQWVNGSAPNLGTLIKYDNEAILTGNEVDYWTNNYTAAPTLRPKLSVTYTDGSHAVAPKVSVSSPPPGAMVGGNVTLTAAASDDRQVTRVEFYVDGVLKSTVTSAPFTSSWNSAGATSASHSFTAKAYDDAGNVTTSAAVNATINNNPPPTTSVTTPGSTVTGTVTVNASATAGTGLTVNKVEFYADDSLVGTATTAPYSTSWNTLDSTQPAFDGSHTLTTKAYDSSGLVTSSTGVATTVANTASTQYKATITGNTNVPLAVVYDPTVQTQTTYPVKVTVTNNSTVTWSNTTTYLRYRWSSPDATPVITDGPNVALPASLAPGASSPQIQLTVTPPTLPAGIDAAQYNLRIDLYDSTGNALFSAKGNQPLDNPVIVNKALKAALGLERYYDYVGQSVGAGVQSLVNVANGNSMLRWEPFNIPGRGMATLLDLTYNSLEEHSDSPAGSNFSLSISTLSRFGEPIDIHPNDADSIAGRSNRWIQFIDGDGTPHKFIGTQAADGTIYWSEPTGVHLYLRQYSTTDVTRWWAFTRPDRVTFFYNQAGYPTYVTDRNGNTISFTLTAVAPADDPGGPKFHVTQVVDAAGQGASPAPNRAFNIAYYVKADKVKSHVRGRIKSITDHIGHELDFYYYDDGNLLKIIQRGGTNADGSFLADRSLVFTYTTSSGAGPAIATAAARVDPDPKTPNESTRLFSVRDPNGRETTSSYITSGQDKWKLLTLTDRAGNTTNYSYDDVNLVTTVAAPTPGGQTARTTRYTYDVNGKPVTITDPLNRQTTLQWTADFTVSQITEPSGAISKYTYNNNGYMTDRYDALNNHSAMTYTNSQVDGNDVSGKWVSGRTTPHISDLSTKTDPKGYPWQFAYDAKGNVSQITDPLNDISKNVYNADGTLANTTDADNHTTTYVTYDANGKSTKIVDAKGSATTFGYNDDGLLQWVQDANHQANSGGIPSQYRSFYYYDSFNRLGEQSTPKLTGGTTDLIWVDTGFDPNGNAIWSMAPHYGASDTMNGDKGTTTYDVMDRPTLQMVPDFSVDPSGERTQYEYDVAGRLIKVTEPKGVATTNTANDYATFTSYDALDRSTALTQYLVDPPTGNIVSTLVSQSCYNTAGDKVAITSPNAGSATVNCAALPTNTTRYTYDADHRILSITDPLGNATSKTYDVNGNVATATDARGKQSSFTYDKLNRQVQATQPFDTSVTPTRMVTSKTVYDAAGNKTQDISPRAYDASADKVTFTNYVTTYHYDELNRLTRTDLPVDTAYQTAYYVHQAYDAVGNATMSSLPVTTTDQTQVTASQKTSVTYFDTGWIQTSKDPANPRVHFDYAPQGWQISRVPEDASGKLDISHEMFTTYLPDGQVQKKTDTHGDPTTYNYDLNDQLTSADSAGGVYDPSQAPTHMDVTYDTLGRITESRSKKATDTNFTYTKFTTYDLNGNLTDSEQNGVETPAGALVTAGRKIHGDFNTSDWLINQIDYGTSTAATDDQKIVNTYTANGLEQTREQYNTVNSAWNKKQVTNWTYFDNGNLKTMNTTNGAGTSTLESHTVSYLDTNNIYVDGNRTKDVSMLKGPSNPACATSCTGLYSYDPRDRLTQEDNGHGTITKYDLDGGGNILTEYLNGTVSKTSTYVGNQLQKTVQGGQTSLYWYTPDANLDCVTNGVGTQANCSPSQNVSPSANLQQDYAYDALNRLSSYRAYSGGTQTDSATYVYDALDRTVSERETHQGKTPRTTSFTYRGLSKDSTQEIQKDDSGTLITTKDYTYDAYGHRLAMTNTPNGQAAQTFTYGYNVHDSVSQLIDANGNATASYGYRPYGDADTAQTQGDTDQKNPTNAYRYGGKRLDSGSGTLDTGARRFGPDTAHFLQQDVFHGALSDLALGTDPISQNRYAMAGGNPLSFIEWDGHMAIADGGGGATTVNQSSRDACSDMCDSHITVGPSSSTSGGSSHHQDNNPLKGIGDFLGGAAKNVGDKAKQAGQWIYDNSSEISQIAGTAAIVTAFIPGLDAISPALFAVSAVTSVMAAHKDMRQGNYGAAALDMLGVLPGGAGSLVKDARAAVNVGRDLKGVSGVVEGAAKEGGVGWRVGDPIDALTKAGNNPAWSTVRGRYWKNVANDAVDGEWSSGNMGRMGRGLAPQHDELGASMELNHITPRRAGGGNNIENLEAVWPWEHAAVDPFRFYTGPTP